MARHRTDENNIDRLCRTRFDGERKRIKLYHRSSCCFYCLGYVLRIFRRSGYDRHGVDALIVDDQFAVGLKEAEPSCSFELLKGEDYIGFTLLNCGREDLIAVFNICNNGTAALAHSVYFGNFDFVSAVYKRAAEESARKQSTLAADADYHN